MTEENKIEEVEVPESAEKATPEQIEKSKTLSADLQAALLKLGIKAFAGIFVCDDNATRVYYHQIGPDLAKGFAIKIIEDVGASKERQKYEADNRADRDRETESLQGNGSPKE